MRALLLSSLILAAMPARAQTILRMATVAPDGTQWARAIRRFAEGVADETHGALKVKVYYGGVAGDEPEMLARVRKDQLDGAFSGGMLCMDMAPTLRVMRVVGLFQNRGEMRYVLSRLAPDTDAELRRAGFALIGRAYVGPSLIFSRRPITSYAELKRTRLWAWDADQVQPAELRWMGFQPVTLPVEAAGAAYDAGKVDGFIGTPSAALAFQWSAQVRYLLPLRISLLDACVIVANRFFDALPVETQRVVRDVAARVVTQLDEAQEEQDEALLGGLFQKQGLTVLPVPDLLRARFYDEAHQAREALPPSVLPHPLMDRVLSMLADYRAEHRPERER